MNHSSNKQWSSEDINYICDQVSRGRARRELANEFKVSKDTIDGIVYRGKIKGSVKPKKEEKPVVDPVTRYEENLTVNRLKRENNDLVEQIRDYKARDEALKEFSKSVTPTIIPREYSSGLREATAQVLFSDWHVEEEVRAIQVAGRNEYSLEIAESRLNRVFNGAQWLIDFHRQAFAIRDVVVWLGGDLMSGYIHEENVETGALSPIETSIWLRDHICAGIDFLLEDTETERLIVPCSFGNHGRTTRKPRRSTGAANSYEWLLYVTLAKLYEGNDRIEFIVDPSAHQYVDIYDFTSHYHHGDEVGYGGGVGGISIPINKRVPRWENVKQSDYHNIGHFHSYLDLGHTNVNGSLIGYNPFAFSIGADFEEPKQTFYLIDSKHGKTCVSPIWAESKTLAA